MWQYCWAEEAESRPQPIDMAENYSVGYWEEDYCTVKDLVKSVENHKAAHMQDEIYEV